MQWFQGGIAEAVTASKQRNAVFVVFVEGKDEASKKTTEAINSPDVSSKLQSGGYVAIRIESDTTAHQQFAQIYQIVPVPSLFFIGNSGLPIEILAGATDSQTLLGRLEVVEAVHAGRQAPPAVPSAASTTAATEVASTASTDSQTILTSKAPSVSAAGSSSGGADSVPAAPVTSISSENISASDSAEASPIEERVERAKELLEKKRLEKLREEQEEHRRKELDRRKMGKDVQEMKRLQQDEEMKLLQEQRRKEKEENALARQRVLDQIAQDRANRSAQAATAQRPQTSSSSSEVTQRSSARVSDGTARLQFRLPDGSTHTSSFEAISNLGQVRSYLTANVELPFRSFMLATTFPRREFSEEENSSTLQDLGLVPTAVMLVIPSGSAGVVQNSRPSWGGISGAINDAIWAVVSPVLMVFTYVRNRLFGDRQTGQGSSTSSANESATSSSDPRKDRRNKRTSTGTIHRTGSSNIHRLHQNHSSSDDDNNTWNGNSTQQM